MDELLNQIGAMLDSKLAPITQRIDALEARPAASAPVVIEHEIASTQVTTGFVTRIVRPGHIFMGKRGGQPVQVPAEHAKASATLAGTMTPDEFEDSERAKRIPRPRTERGNVDIAREMYARAILESKAQIDRDRHMLNREAEKAAVELARAG
jgi:hypothetical protein